MKNILLYFSVTVLTLIAYIYMERDKYNASWRVHIFAILVSLFILFYTKKLNIYAALFIYSIMLWHLFDFSAEYFYLK